MKVRDKHIGQVTELSVLDARDWFLELDQHLKPQAREIAVRILKEINERLGFLVDVGLEYLTLSRASAPLSAETSA